MQISDIDINPTLSETSKKEDLIQQAQKAVELGDFETLKQTFKSNFFFIIIYFSWLLKTLLLIETGTSLLVMRDIESQTLLHLSCEHGYREITLWLLKKIPEIINEKDKNGWTPLHCACNNGHLQIIQDLLASKADPTLVNSDYSSPLHYLVKTPCNEENIEIIEKIIDIMIKRGFDLNAQNKNGET